MTKKYSEKRKIFIALGIVVGVVALFVGLYFIANAIVVDECGGNPCRGDSNPICKTSDVCEPLTLWESIFGE